MVEPGSGGALRARLRDRAGRLGPFATALHHRTEVGSTNDVAARLAAEAAPHGTVVVADAQRAGRGRHGARWFSPPGAGLYCSLLLRSRCHPVLTLATGLAVAEVVRDVGRLAVELEWPNDVVARGTGGPRKVAGILAEAVTGPDGGGAGAGYVIVGIGINLTDAAWPPELAATAGSIAGLGGRTVDRDELLVELLAALAARYADLDAGRRAAVLSRWRALAPSSQGVRVSWRSGGARREGVTAGIDTDGALLVRVGPALERLWGGEVRQVRRRGGAA